MGFPNVMLFTFSRHPIFVKPILKTDEKVTYSLQPTMQLVSQAVSMAPPGGVTGVMPQPPQPILPPQPSHQPGLLQQPPPHPPQVFVC